MSTQDQNTPQQKDARPRWARLHKKTPASGEEPLHYSKADMLKQSNIWFRKQGAPSSFLHVNVLSMRSHAPCHGSCGRASCTSAISSCATFSSS